MINTAWWEPEKFKDKLPFLQQRAKLITAVRQFFDEQDFLEVETPILQIMPCADMHIHGFPTQLKGLDLQVERHLWLHTSPEFEMKKLLVAGLPKIYQICHVFRNGEGSSRHVPEFTMIEWYRANAGYEQIMQDCIDLFQFCANKLGMKTMSYKNNFCDVCAAWEKISVNDAFLKYAGFSLSAYMTETESHRAAAQSNDCSGFYQAALSAGVSVRPQDSWEEIFFAVMAQKIEPFLGIGTPSIIYDYPVSMAALSRKSDTDSRFAKRFEVYVCGLELANAFDELTDAQEQRRRFELEMEAKQALYGERYDLDEDFLQALDYGMPPAGGIALGIDRLAMVMAGADDIEQVLWCGRP